MYAGGKSKEAPEAEEATTASAPPAPEPVTVVEDFMDTNMNPVPDDDEGAVADQLPPEHEMETNLNPVTDDGDGANAEETVRQIAEEFISKTDEVIDKRNTKV